jgi:hypothetical protein
MHARILLSLTLTFSSLAVSGCERLHIVLRDGDLAFSATSDDPGQVQRLGASKDFSEIANAKLAAVRQTADLGVTEVDVVETHYVHRTNDVVYTGRITFRCRSGEDFCSPIQTTSISGSRPRNVFWRWPSRMGVNPFGGDMTRPNNHSPSGPRER